MKKSALIIQGGGFRTAFSAGVLDAFMSMNYNPFDAYFAVSGGTVAVSYYLSQQYQACFNAMKFLSSNSQFINYRRIFKGDNLMNIDYFYNVTRDIVPFLLNRAINNISNKKMRIVITNIKTGQAEYYHPTNTTWVDSVIASCTLPFITKGKHLLNGNYYMDGGWSDPLPVKQAIKEGYTDITIIRTSPKNLKLSMSWIDYIGSITSSNEALKKCFEKNHLIYNQSIDFIHQLQKTKYIKIKQIAPLSPLKCGTYSNSIQSIADDYRYGVSMGIDFLNKSSSSLLKSG